MAVAGRFVFNLKVASDSNDASSTEPFAVDVAVLSVWKISV
jgi:hypothetical protein